LERVQKAVDRFNFVHFVVYFSSSFLQTFVFVKLFFNFHVCSSSFCGVLSHGRLELSTKVEDETSPLMTLTLL
jgi:hypothetical protein